MNLQPTFFAAPVQPVSVPNSTPMNPIYPINTLIIENEEHTVGSLLQSYLLADSNVSNAGYNVPHPLEKKCKVTYILKNQNIKTMNDVVSKITTDLDILASMLKDSLD